MDGITLYAILHETSLHLPLRVQKIYHPDPFVLSLDLWSRDFRGQLTLSLSQNRPFFGFSSAKMANPQHPSGFCLGLRKRLEGGVLKRLRQEDLDRVVYLEFSGHDDLGNQKSYDLVFDAAGKNANIGLFADGALLMSLKAPDGERFAAGHSYRPPEVTGKMSLLDGISEEEVRSAFLNAGEAFETIIMRKMAGFGKELARSLVQDLPAGSPFDKVRTLTGRLKDLENRLSEHRFEPGVYRDSRQGLIIHIVPLSHLELVRAFNTCHEATSYQSREEAVKNEFENRKISLESWAKKIHRKLLSRYAGQLEDWRQQDDLEKYRLYGQLLDASGKDLPAGLTEVEVLNFYEDPPIPIVIPLEPQLSLKANARKYYSRYKKLKRGRDILGDSLERLKSGLSMAEGVLEDISRAKTIENLELSAKTLDHLAREHRIPMPKNLPKDQKVPNSKEKRAQSPNRVATVEESMETTKEQRLGCRVINGPFGFQFFYGRSSWENDYLYHKVRKPGDIWLHAKNQKGAHVLIRPPSGKKITEEILLEGARIAAQNSSAKNSPKVEVDWVNAMNVNKPRGGPPGFVTYTGQKTIMVSLGQRSKDDLGMIER